MYIGVDYYPEYWPKEMIEEDIRRMGVKTVRRWGQMAIGAVFFVRASST